MRWNVPHWQASDEPVAPRRYSTEEFKKNFKVGDCLLMIHCEKRKKLNIRITAIGENRIMYRIISPVSPERLADIPSLLWAPIKVA